MNLRNLVDSLKENGGFSYSYNTGEYNPNNGYFVSLQGYESTSSLNKFSDKDIKEFLAKNNEVLSREDAYFGGWSNDNVVFLDVTIKIPFLERAIYLGIINNQKAIYDAFKDNVITLPSPQRSGTESQQKFYAQYKALEITSAYNESLKQ